MNAFLLYFLQVNLAIALFYLFYRLFFVRDTFWKTRRHYLLLSILISFVHPMLSVESWLEKPEPVQQMIVQTVALPEFVVIAGPSAVVVPETTVFTPENVILCIYGLVSFVLFIRMLMQLASIFRIRWQGRRQIVKGVNVIALEKEIAPFSFFGWVFLNPALHTEEETRQILIHEQAHARQHHSLDVLLSELLTIVFWCNPAVWLLKREIRQNLEYLADNKVIRSGFDSKTYQYHLLQLTYQVPELKITNQFNVSSLKKRIIMMNQRKSNKAGLLKYSLVVPLALALVLSSNAQEIVTKAKNVVNQQSDKVNTLKLDSTEMFTKEELESASKAGKSMNDATGITNSVDNKIQAYFKADKMPQYPGGEKALMDYLANHLRFPAEASKVSEQGRVVVRFIVNETGKIQHVQVLTGQLGSEKVYHTSNEKKSVASKELQMIENEAVKVVGNMPSWIPGQVKGKNVAVVYALPINFKAIKSTAVFYSVAVKADGSPDKLDKRTLDNQKVYSTVDKMPQFQGGHEALMNYLNRNVKYPVGAAENGVQGTVIVRFIVNSSGKIEQAEVANGDASRVIAPAVNKTGNAQLEEQHKKDMAAHYGLLEQEALRVINSMPQWIPGEQNGEKVAVSYAIPVRFKLDGGKEGETSKIYESVEKMPAYPGGDKALFEYLSRNIKYPKDAEVAGIKGTVIVRFVVSEQGKVIDAKVVRGVSPSLDQEALRVVKAMPNWIPGEQNGKKVAVSYAMPVMFKLDGEAKVLNLRSMFRDGKPLPLCIMDGKEVSFEYANNLKKNDVESATIYKDTASLKQFGDKGKNGVIIIKMKK